MQHYSAHEMHVNSRFPWACRCSSVCNVSTLTVWNRPIRQRWFGSQLGLCFVQDLVLSGHGRGWAIFCVLIAHLLKGTARCRPAKVGQISIGRSVQPSVPPSSLYRAQLCVTAPPPRRVDLWPRAPRGTNGSNSDSTVSLAQWQRREEISEKCLTIES